MVIANRVAVTSVAAAGLYWFLAVPSLAAATPSRADSPDFTHGDKIRQGANHDWNLPERLGRNVSSLRTETDREHQS